MPRPRGVGLADKHRERISAAKLRAHAEDPGYAMRISEGVSKFWTRDRIERAKNVLAELEDGILAQRIAREIWVTVLALEDGEQIDKYQKELLRALERLREREPEMSLQDAASTPYVGETQTMHRPMTGTHSHDHAAFGHHDHTDGIHSHVHTHNNDATHEHEHAAGKDPGPGMDVSDSGGSGIYGRIMNTTSPVERARLRKLQQAQHEARR